MVGTTLNSDNCPRKVASLEEVYNVDKVKRVLQWNIPCEQLTVTNVAEHMRHVAGQTTVPDVSSERLSLPAAFTSPYPPPELSTSGDDRRRR